MKEGKRERRGEGRGARSQEPRRNLAEDMMLEDTSLRLVLNAAKCFLEMLKQRTFLCSFFSLFFTFITLPIDLLF